MTAIYVFMQACIKNTIVITCSHKEIDNYTYTGMVFFHGNQIESTCHYVACQTAALICIGNEIFACFTHQ